MNAPRPQENARLHWGFPAFAAAVIAANAVLVQWHPQLAGAPAPEWPVMFDLLLFLPLVCLALNWRKGWRTAALKAAAVAGLGALAGSLMLPADSKQLWHVVDELRFVVIAGVLLVQAGVLVMLLRTAFRARHGQNLELALARAIGERFGDGGFARMLQLEGRLWLYALARRPVRHAFPGHRHFSVGKQGMNASNQFAFLVLVGVELPIAHFLIMLFDPFVAAVVTALSAYGFLFLLAEYRATRLRPVSVTGRGLQLRHGVATDLWLDWGVIAAAEPTRGPVRRARGELRLIGMGEANVRIDLVPGTTLPGLFGPRAIERIHLGVDDADGLIHEIRARLSHPARGPAALPGSPA